MSFEQVIEGIRTAQATYAQALDDGRVAEIPDVFTEDGVVDIEGVGVYEGREAIRAAYADWAPRSPQRHMISNVLVTEWSADEARATSDVALLQLRDSGWVIFMVARYDDTVRNEHGTWRFSRRTTRFVSDAERGCREQQREVGVTEETTTWPHHELGARLSNWGRWGAPLTSVTTASSGSPVVSVGAVASCGRVVGSGRRSGALGDGLWWAVSNVHRYGAIAHRVGPDGTRLRTR